MTTAPIPNHVEGIWCAPDGSIVRIRPIEVADATLIHEFVASLESWIVPATALFSRGWPRRNHATILFVPRSDGRSHAPPVSWTHSGDIARAIEFR